MAEETSTEIAAPSIERPASTAIMTTEQFDSTWRMSKALAASGTFKDIGKEEGSKALARIMMGADLGMSPTQALMGIDIVKGNPQIRGVALGRMVRKSAKTPVNGESYDYAVIDRGFEPGAEYATVALYRRDPDGTWPTVDDDEGAAFPTILGPVIVRKGHRLPEGVEAFSIDQANRRGLIKDAGGAWKDQPEVMCVWRALSQLVRFYAPDVIGGMPVYTEADGLRQPIVTAGGPDPEWEGWQGVSVARAGQLEALVTRAVAVGHAGLADRHTVLMRAQGMSDEQFAGWVGEQFGELEALAAKTTDGTASEDVEPEPGGDAVLTFGGETFTFSDTDDPYQMIMSAMGEGAESMMRVSLDLMAMSDRLAESGGVLGQDVADAEAKRYALLADALRAESEGRGSV